MVYVWVAAGVAFAIWALVGLCEAHAGVSRLFEHIEDERSLAQRECGSLGRELNSNMHAHGTLVS
jgi:hypothetical protein